MEVCLVSGTEALLFAIRDIVHGLVLDLRSNQVVSVSSWVICGVIEHYISLYKLSIRRQR